MSAGKVKYKEIKIRMLEEELAVLNCRVARTGLSREQYIRSLLADRIPAEYPPADYRQIIQKLNELQDTMDELLEEIRAKRDTIRLYITLQTVARTADMLRSTVIPLEYQEKTKDK